MTMYGFLLPSDAFVWSLGTDARLRSTIVTLMMLDEVPDWQVVVERFARLADSVPQFRCRIASSPGPLPPRWVDDPDFDLGFHVRRVSASQPGNFDALLEIARIEAMADFDAARPPWTVTLIDGIGDGAALLCKLHHSLSDGVGAVAIAVNLFDQGQQTPYRRESEDLKPNPIIALASLSLRTAKTAMHPLSAMAAALSTGTSIARTIRPTDGPQSSIMLTRSKSRRLRTFDVSRTRLHAAGHAAGGSINDAFLAAMAGGLRLYHDVHGCPLSEATVMLPISVRPQNDPAGGNRATLVRLDIPVDISDPRRRVSAVHRATSRVRKEKSINYVQLMAALLNLAPLWYVDSVLRRVDFVASDVPGLPMRVSLAGATVTAQYAFAPTIGGAFNATLLSYGDQCSVGVNIDTGAVPDFELFGDCLKAGIDEVLALP